MPRATGTSRIVMEDSPTTTYTSAETPPGELGCVYGPYYDSTYGVQFYQQVQNGGGTAVAAGDCAIWNANSTPYVVREPTTGEDDSKLACGAFVSAIPASGFGYMLKEGNGAWKNTSGSTVNAGANLSADAAGGFQTASAGTGAIAVAAAQVTNGASGTAYFTGVMVLA